MAPSSSSNPTKDSKPLRQLAAEKIYGKSSNASQLGDPISLKAETNAKAPAPTEGDLPESDGSSNNREPPSSSGGPYGTTMKDGRTLKGMMKDKIEQAEKGKGENPTLLGDPTSLKAETTEKDPVDHDNGPSDSQGSKRRDSKL